MANWKNLTLGQFLSLFQVKKNIKFGVKIDLNLVTILQINFSMQVIIYF